MRQVWLWIVVVCGLGCGCRVSAADAAPTFVDDVLPLLEAKCFSCHSSEKQEGNLRLDSLAAAQAGGDLGPALVPRDLQKSLLVKAISFRDPDLQMPPKQKLSDKEIATLTHWVKAGAEWPEPAVVLFEDDPKFLAALTSGNGQARLIRTGAFAGKSALSISPLQREAAKIPGWNFVIREQPRPGEFRFLRLAWKKRGAGSVMMELASSGRWPDAKVPQGRYVAGPNTTGWSAISVSDTAPAEWTVVTFDLWKDLGDFTLTGCAPTCDRGDEAFFDSIILGPTIASLDAYRPGAGATDSSSDDKPIGDALTDKRNPIRKLFRGERLDLWSLKKPAMRESIPTNSIDEFIRARLAQEKLQPSPAADRRTLIRRLTFDLTGLPPTPQDVAAFVADQSPDAYAKLVNRLLNSPRYGERQARLWMDVVRYADTNGYERDEFRPLAWQYRDYVIRAFNQDKPFDQFIREQLAGDELFSGAPKTAAEVDMLIATGYLRLGQWDSTAPIFQEEQRLRAEMMADLTNTTAAAFLGLTFSCCQCHDHKYDPLSQADHYRLRAFFAGVTPRDNLVIDTADEQTAINAHNTAIDKQTAPLRDEQKKLLDAARPKIAEQRRAKFAAEILELLKTDENQRDEATKKKLKPFLDQLNVNDKDAQAAFDAPAKERFEQLSKQIATLDGTKRKNRHAMAATDVGEAAPATHVFYQGDFASPRDAVEPGFVSVLTPGPADIAKPRPATTGRRLALARWIASPENPWTARVIVNRIWQQHFGVGLVASANDFGYSGARPTHPELLDWLALQFVRDGWSIKKLHQRIVTSDTYRQSSATTAARSPTADAANTLLWRQNVQRLDAETLRDALLSVSGMLRPVDSGKPLWPEVPEDLRKAQPAILEAEKGGDGGRMQGWYTDPADQVDVRSIFLIRKRCLPIPFLQAFDLPDTTTSCARRDTTVVAPQALMLLNSPDGVRYAGAFAERVRREAGEELDRQVVTAFQTALLRTPTDDERPLAKDLLQRHAELHKAAGNRASTLALADLCRAILNLNEFIFID